MVTATVRGKDPTHGPFGPYQSGISFLGSRSSVYCLGLGFWRICRGQASASPKLTLKPTEEFNVHVMGLLCLGILGAAMVHGSQWISCPAVQAGVQHFHVVLMRRCVPILVLGLILTQLWQECYVLNRYAARLLQAKDPSHLRLFDSCGPGSAPTDIEASDQLRRRQVDSDLLLARQQKKRKDLLPIARIAKRRDLIPIASLLKSMPWPLNEKYPYVYLYEWALLDQVEKWRGDLVLASGDGGFAIVEAKWIPRPGRKRRKKRKKPRAAEGGGLQARNRRHCITCYCFPTWPRSFSSLASASALQPSHLTMKMGFKACWIVRNWLHVRGVRGLPKDSFEAFRSGFLAIANFIARRAGEEWRPRA